ncbi:MAG: pyridoxal-phosphate dependent enzyme [SAR202 cluster bacterium]|nr:pyridoxal-phosphate dependent enzyme [SAR202 cluster bacterium]
MTTEMSYDPIPIELVHEAAERIRDTVVRTPLVKLNGTDEIAEIHLKLENLQPIGSFKLRGAANKIAQIPPTELKNGVWTCSAGNMAQGVAWNARRMGIPCRVVVPDVAPEAKLNAITRLGAQYHKVPFAEFVETFATRSHPKMRGMMVHPFSDTQVMAGNATIGVEILDDLPDVEAIVIAYAGGGLACGIASAVRALKPGVKLYAAEVSTGAPFAAALAAGKPTVIEYTPTFVDGIGAPRVLPEMFSLARGLLDGAIVSTPEDIAAAVRIIAEQNHVISEGAGAASVAAALTGKAGNGKIACVISGGNIDPQKMIKILRGEVP